MGMVTVLDEIPFVPDADALLRKLRVESSADFAPEIRDVVERAAKVVRPKALFDVCYVEERGEDTVTIDGITFTSRVLRTALADVHRVFPFLATCGTELDALLAEYNDELLRYSVECLKELALSAARHHLAAYVKSVYDLPGLSSMHPGSGDAVVWPIQQQAQLFRLIGDVESLIGVRLSETYLMQPNKTVSGVFFPSEVSFTTCRLCRRDRCPGRRAPFDALLWSETQPEG
jgi:hypothetical protein